MRFKKIALVLAACMVLGAVAANAAQAAQWTVEVGGKGVTLAGPEKVSCLEHGTENLTIISTILGTPITFTALGIECEEATINTVAVDKEAHSEGFLNFTEIRVTPATCSVKGGHITTEHLTDRVIMDPTAGSTTVFDTFFTDNGVPIATISLEGADCPFAAVNASLTGTFCGESVVTNGAGVLVANETGDLSREQILRFGMAQQTTGNSAAAPCKLLLGKAAATLTGAVGNILNGVNPNKPFGAD
jgi:hypothetical protein